MTERIKATHDTRCSTWETWETVERDIMGHVGPCQWEGCRSCGVAILVTA